MLITTLLAPFQAFRSRVAAIERVLSRRRNMLIFLVIRLVLMSAMVLGFIGTSLSFSR